MIELILLIAILLVVLFILFLVIRGIKTDVRDLENSLTKAISSSGFLEKVGEISGHVQEIKDLHRSIEQMLRVPAERGAFGEIALENILTDHLPPDMFGMRKRVLDGKTPDAHIKSTVGIICIDSKFPLENFRRFQEEKDEKAKEDLNRKFLSDVRGHLAKIRDDYVKPDKGSAEFAFAFIPSEAVYWHLVNNAYDMLREFAKEGVQVVSPLTLAHKIELIKAGVHARKLSEEAQLIKDSLLKLARDFEELDEKWKTFFDGHLTRAYKKAQDVDSSYRKIREDFDSIERLTQP